MDERRSQREAQRVTRGVTNAVAVQSWSTTLSNEGSIKVDVRIISETTRDLEAAVKEGAFREDLFYRVNVFPIAIPPLRERVEDIPALAWAFVEESSRVFGKRIAAIASSSLTDLQRYPWPGNVRALRNVIERAMILATSCTLTPNVPCVPSVPSSLPSTRLVDVQTRHMTSCWKAAGGAFVESTAPPACLTLEWRSWEFRGRGNRKTSLMRETASSHACRPTRSSRDIRPAKFDLRDNVK